MIGGQKQQGGDGSVNVQADTINFSGLTFSEAKELALLVFKDNFIIFQREAKDIAEERATQITDNFLKDLSASQPQLLERIKDPATAHATFNAQKAYAISGEPELEGLLIDLLKKRYGEGGRNRRTIVIDSAISIAPLLTGSQLALLRLLFLVCYVKHSSTSLENFCEFLEKNHCRALATINPDEIEIDIAHLDYLNCIRTSIGKRNESDVFKNYSGLFSRGFSFDRLAELSLSYLPQVMIPCLNDSTLLQLRGLDETINNKSLEAAGVGSDVAGKYLQLSREVEMNFEDVCTMLEAIKKDYAEVFRLVFKTSMTSANITPLGSTIAHADCRLNADWDAPLSIWVK